MNAYPRGDAGDGAGTGPKRRSRKAAEGMQLPDESPDSTRNLGLLEATGGWVAHGPRATPAGGIDDLRSGLAKAGGPDSASETTAFLRFQLALALAAGPGHPRRKGSPASGTASTTRAYLVPLAYLALGRTYEAAGKPDSAALAYGRFVRLWDKADPELQGRVAEAREALQRLTAEPR